MIGAITGDIVGSRFEWSANKEKQFLFFHPSCIYTDDSLMTLAIAEAFVLREGRWREDDFQDTVIDRMVKMGRKYSFRHTWGRGFYKWFMEDHTPYNSFGNGAGMRVSPVGWIAESEDDVRFFSRLVTEVSHNHPEGLKGAEAIAMGVYLARIGTPMEEIRHRMIGYYPEIERMTWEDLHINYGYGDDGRWISCQGSVPQAIVCFLESTDFEDAIRNAVSLGADTDTQGCMAGALAEAYYGIDPALEERVMEYLPEDLQNICYAFRSIRQKRGTR